MKYVLVTPARNEELNIRRTLEAVTAQTVRPLRWVVVSDGSTDGTDDIVHAFEAEHSFIRFFRFDSPPNRNFASKIHAFNAGCGQLSGLDYEFIGNLDADISFEPRYYENVIGKFEEDGRLGVVGGVGHEMKGGAFLPVPVSQNSVLGGVQFFRRSCFEEIGGYIPLRYGGVDTVAEVMARMNGWGVETFHDLTVYHHELTGSKSSSPLAARFREGLRDYSVGYHVLFEIVRNAFRIRSKKPFPIGVVAILAGYLAGPFRRHDNPVPEEVIRYLRSEQWQRLKGMFRRGPFPRQRTKGGVLPVEQ